MELGLGFNERAIKKHFSMDDREREIKRVHILSSQLRKIKDQHKFSRVRLNLALVISITADQRPLSGPNNAFYIL